jgi:small conductance mechanosensitive channel
MLVWIEPPSFFRALNTEWLTDLREFLHSVLPKIVVTAVGAWLLTRVLKLITNRVLKVAERHSGGAGHLAQVRTLTSVIRATGIGVIFFLAALEILPLLGFKLEPLLASAGVAGVALGLAAQTIVKDCLNGILILVEDQYNIGDVVRLACRERSRPCRCAGRRCVTATAHCT